jgi:hypothetical protein
VTEYLVTFSIDVEATSPEDAVDQVVHLVRDDCFVWRVTGLDGETFKVDRDDNSIVPVEQDPMWGKR